MHLLDFGRPRLIFSFFLQMRERANYVARVLFLGSCVSLPLAVTKISFLGFSVIFFSLSLSRLEAKMRETRAQAREEEDNVIFSHYYCVPTDFFSPKRKKKMVFLFSLTHSLVAFPALIYFSVPTRAEISPKWFMSLWLFCFLFLSNLKSA